MSNITVTTDAKTLQTALATAVRFTDRRHPIPVLSTVLVSVTKSQVTLTTTDLDMAANIPVKALARGEGAICLPLAV